MKEPTLKENLRNYFQNEDKENDIKYFIKEWLKQKQIPNVNPLTLENFKNNFIKELLSELEVKTNEV